MSSSSSVKEKKEYQPKLSAMDRIDLIKNKRLFSLIFPLIMLAVIFTVFVLLTHGKFLKKTVIKGIFNQSLIVATMGIAVSFIFTTGNVDFSVGNVMGLACVLGGLVYQATESMAAMLVVILLSGIALMAFNSTLCVAFNVKPAMVAIVSMSICSAISTVLIGADPIKIPYRSCKALEGNFRYITFVAYFLFCLLVYHKTSVGRKLRFIGGNEKCARQTGINDKKMQYVAFLLAGIGVGLAGIFTVLRGANIPGNLGNGMGTDVMLATVLGGMSIFGGTKSNCYAGVIGAVTVTILNKGLLMVGVPSTLIQGVRGVVFLLLVFLNSEREKTLPTRQQF